MPGKFSKKGIRSCLRSGNNVAFCAAFRELIFLFIFLGLVCVGNPPAVAQQIGLRPFVAPEPVELGFVENAVGDLHLEIPLGSFPQRAARQSLTYRLTYDSGIWTVDPIHNVWVYNSFFGANTDSTDGGWSLASTSALNVYFSSGPDGCGTSYWNFLWLDTSGTQHEFPIDTETSTCQGVPNVPSGDAFAADSSGYHMYVTNYTDAKVYGPDGTLVCQFPVSSDPNGNHLDLEDSNGNYYSETINLAPLGFFDTTGREAIRGYAPNLASLNSQGQYSQYSVTIAIIPVKTAFGQSGVTEYSGSLAVVQSIGLPDGSSYTFKYDCDSSTGNTACGSPAGQSGYYGLLTSLVLPTGGTVTYGYTTFSNSYGNRSRWLDTRTSANGTWTYSPQVISTCSSTQVGCQQKVTVTKPSGASTVYTFTLNNGAWPIQIQTSDSSGSLLSTVTNTYDFSVLCPFKFNGTLPGCIGAGYIRLLTAQTTLPIPGGSITKKDAYTYDSPQTGNITEVKQWAYYPGTSPSFPSVADRATYTTYASIGTKDIDKPLSVTVCNNSGSNSACPGGGSIVAQTLNTYDSYGANCPGGGLESVASVTNHDTNFGTSYTTRGNLTYAKQWVVGSTYLTAQYCYDTTGQITEKFDPAGNYTQYGYTDNYYYDNGSNPPTRGGTSYPSNAYVSSISQPLIGTRYFGYYYGSGKRALLTDENGATTYDHYMDSLDRPTSVIFPTGWNLETYPSATELDLYAGVGDASPSTGCTSCQHKAVSLDSWDRENQRTLENSPNGAINVETNYDANGRVSGVSLPSPGPNYSFESYIYDGLDRQIEVVHPNNQNSQSIYGVSVANSGGLTSQQGSPSTYGYGYPVLTADEDGKEKQEWLDGFGRIIEVDESTTNSTPGKGSATIDGFEQKMCSTSAPVQTTTTSSTATAGCPVGDGYIYDSGDVSISVGGFTADAGYGQGSTASSIANALASRLNASTSPVTATLSGTTISLTSKATGGQADYSLSTSTSWDDTNFSSPSFTATLSGSTLTGGSGLLNPVATLYKYDALGNLTQVIQGSQTRTFTYDGLSRKTSENTPESGTITYSYTSSGGLCSGSPGNLCSKTDARGITTTYTYDALNRITAKSYSNGQGSVTYSYDQGGAGAFALGRLTQMTDPSGSESYTYYADGHVKTLQKVIGSTLYTISYQYNPGGELTQITYPSGRVLQYGYDNVGWLCAVAPSTSGCTATNPYASAYTYDSAGHVTGFTYGNGIFATYGFSPTTEQMNCLDYSTTNRNGSCTHDSTTKFGLNYYYQHDSTNCPNGATGDDGLIQCISDAVDSGRTVGYAYDGVNRLISGATNGSTNYPKWGLAWTYDQWGNRLSESVTAGSGPSSSLSFNSQNQPTGYSYDASGNMTNESGVGCNYSYDADNRLVSVSSCASASYTYDANGLRVKKLANGTTTVSVYSGSKVIAEYDNGAAPSSPSREYVYGRGQFLAMVIGTTTTYYQQDHLSVRMATNSSGGVAWQAATYPYGEPWYTSNGTPEFFFTTYQRDQETGLDYALARYYDSRTGGFCSADPVQGTPTDPESWNRYVYVRDNPVNLTDPSGKFWFFFIEFLVGLVLSLLSGNPRFLANVSILGTIWIPTTGPFPGSTPTTLPGSSPTITWEQIAVPGHDRDLLKYVVPFDPEINSVEELLSNYSTANCLQTGLKAQFPSANVTVGDTAGEVGGHQDFNVSLSFPELSSAGEFYNQYGAAANASFPPPSRFGLGPAVHLEAGAPSDLPFAVTSSGSILGAGTVSGTAHIDWFNPKYDNPLQWIGHGLVDGAWGHVVQWSGGYINHGPGNIDPKACPWQ